MPTFSVKKIDYSVTATQISEYATRLAGLFWCCSKYFLFDKTTEAQSYVPSGFKLQEPPEYVPSGHKLLLLPPT